MEKAIKQIIKQLNGFERRISALEDSTRPIKKKEAQQEVENQHLDDLVLSITNKAGDCDESDKIQSNILDQKGMNVKILLSFYVSYKYFKNAWLTTGDIEKITSNLGVRIAVSNVSNKIKSNLRQYLESGSVRRLGLPTPYRLNRNGVKYFESLLGADEKQ